MSTFKVIRMVKLGDKMPAEFRQEFLERHRELKRVAKKVVASVTTTDGQAGKEPAFAGMAALYYSTAAEARAALGDDPSKTEVAAEEFLLAQQGDADRLIKPSGQLKLVRTFVRRKDLSLAQFKDYWLKTHVGLHKRAISETPVVRSVATLALPPESGGNEPSFDALVELYVATIEDFRTLFASPVMALMRKDEENFTQLDSPAAVVFVAEELVL
jgi:uncharacterized protein (TIGR02118 family)